MTNCSTCKQPITGQSNVVRFTCPKCTKHEIMRCAHCRKIAATYTCPACGFEGPN